nr:hypothetical protein [Tanacetum cinerariifolium]
GGCGGSDGGGVGWGGRAAGVWCWLRCSEGGSGVMDGGEARGGE